MLKTLGECHYNYIDYSKIILEKYYKDDNIIVTFGLGFNCNNTIEGDLKHKSKIINSEDIDINKFCEDYRKSPDFKPVDLVFMCRVLEHIPVRQIDYYLYSISAILKPFGKLICIVPDMKKCTKELEKEFESENPNYFRIQRLTYEVLQEGDDVLWRHSLWTSKKSLRYYIEMERLFKVDDIYDVVVDTDLVPPQLVVEASRSYIVYNNDFPEATCTITQDLDF